MKYLFLSQKATTMIMPNEGTEMETSHIRVQKDGNKYMFTPNNVMESPRMTCTLTCIHIYIHHHQYV